MDITVYTKPECVQCKYTKQLLDEKGLNYTEIDASPGTQAYGELQAKGITALPYVVAGNQTWAGYHRDKLRGLPSIPGRAGHRDS
jgi:glutaredoxin-like protein NrdH